MRVKGVKAGIRDLQINGTMRVEMRPLLKEQPIVGGVAFYFLTEPQIEFNLTNVADVLDMPGLSDLLRRAIAEQIRALCVLPNKMAFPLAPNILKRQLKCRPPAGAVRIELIEGRQLKKSDFGMLGLGKSDPYALIAINDETFRTQTIKNTVNPKWNYACEALIQFVHGQSIKIDVLDEDQGNKDDFLGRAELQLDYLLKNRITEGWLKLEETTTGEVKYRATWLSLERDLSHLHRQCCAAEKARNKYLQLIQCEPTCHIGTVATLCVYLDSAENLPEHKRMEPSAFVELSVGSETKRSRTKYDQSCPVWEEMFHFMVGDPNSEHHLVLTVKDEKRDNTELGHVSFDMKQLIPLKDNSYCQPIALKGRASGATIHFHVQLKLLCESSYNSFQNQISEETDEAIAMADATDPNSSEHSGSHSQSSPIRTPTIKTTSPDDDGLRRRSNGSRPQYLAPAATGIDARPSLEDMIYSTVKPMAHISEIGTDRIDMSQKYRTESAGPDRNLAMMTSPSVESEDPGIDFPKLKVSITKDKRLITLMLHRAANLPKIATGHHDEQRPPDAYAKIVCLPSRSRDHERKTLVHRYTCDPEFEETFEYSMDEFREELTGFEIELRTKSQGSSFTNVFSGRKRHLGLTYVDLDDLGSQRSITQWYDLERGED